MKVLWFAKTSQVQFVYKFDHYFSHEHLMGVNGGYHDFLRIATHISFLFSTKRIWTTSEDM